MVEITVGTHTVSVVAQPVPYLEDRLGKYLLELAGAGAGEKITSAESLIGVLGDNIYEVLVTLVPELGEKMPAHEFNGYPTKEAYEARGERTKESLSKAYTFPQLVEAIKAIVKVNQFDQLERVMSWGGKALDGVLEKLDLGDDVKGKIAEAVKEAVAQVPSSTSPSANGASGSTKPSEPSPTPPKSSD